MFPTQFYSTKLSSILCYFAAFFPQKAHLSESSESQSDINPVFCHFAHPSHCLKIRKTLAFFKSFSVPLCGCSVFMLMELVSESPPQKNFLVTKPKLHLLLVKINIDGHVLMCFNAFLPLSSTDIFGMGCTQAFEFKNFLFGNAE